MKQTLISFLILLLIAQSAFALTGKDYPTYAGETIEANSMGANIDGDWIQLKFDDSADYSYITDGSVQACFFAYNAASTAFVELYLIVPETVQAGDVITPAYCAQHACSNCSVTCVEAVGKTDNFYTVFSLNGEGYPAGTDYAITIDSVTRENNAITMSGTFSCNLARYDDLTLSDERLSVSSANFSCTVSAHVESKKPAPNTSVVPELKPTVTPFAVKV